MPAAQRNGTTISNSDPPPTPSAIQLRHEDATGNGAFLFLWNKVQLTCQHGYYQNGVNSATTAIMQADTSGDAVSGGDSSITIDVYASVIFDASPNTYGQLTFGGSVIFDGTLQPEVEAGQPLQCDVLKVIGTITFSVTSYILPIVNGSSLVDSYWQVITCTGGMTNWNEVQVPSGWSTGNPGFIYE